MCEFNNAFEERNGFGCGVVVAFLVIGCWALPRFDVVILEYGRVSLWFELVQGHILMDRVIWSGRLESGELGLVRKDGVPEVNELLAFKLFCVGVEVYF